MTGLRMADANLDDLHTDLKPLAIQWLGECLKNGLNVRIIQTWRDPLYQDKLFAQGRTNPGSIVTYLTGAQSLHCFTMGGEPASKAFDFACFDENGAYIANGTDEHYALAAQVGITLGLEWGGTWSHFKDFDHLQLSS
jgi:peptidoglycan LD-endopeptidase CwlK